MNKTVEDIGRKITEHLHNEFESLLQDNIEQIDGIDDVVSWFQQSEQNTRQNTDGATHLRFDRDEAISKISNKIVEQLVQYIPRYMGSLIVENIKISTKEKEKGAKFDISFSPDPFISYVEIVKKINGVDAARIKVEFKIESDIQILDNKINLNDKKALVMGKMKSHITINLHSSAGALSEDRTLKEIKFESDLSDVALYLS